MNFMLQKVCNTHISGNTHSEDSSKRIVTDQVIFNSRSNVKESLSKKEKGGNFVYTFEVKAFKRRLPVWSHRNLL